MLVEGALKIQGLTDLTCFTTFLDLLKALEQYVAVEIPDTITNVIISNVQPTDPSRNVIWFRSNNAGSFTGIFVYSGGEWVQMFPTPLARFSILGDSNNPPPGYKVVTADEDGYDTAQVAFLKERWYPSGDGPYTMFDVIYTGL